jgi:hypothetical protein
MISEYNFNCDGDYDDDDDEYDDDTEEHIDGDDYDYDDKDNEMLVILFFVCVYVPLQKKGQLTWYSLYKVAL